MKDHDDVMWPQTAAEAENRFLPVVVFSNWDIVSLAIGIMPRRYRDMKYMLASSAIRLRTHDVGEEELIFHRRLGQWANDFILHRRLCQFEIWFIRCVLALVVGGAVYFGVK